MPIPVSVTAIRTSDPPFTGPAATVILPPSGVNLIAFESRLSSTWRTRPRSLDPQARWCGADDHRVPTLLHLRLDAAGRFGQQCREIDCLRLQLHPPRGDTLQVEQLVDQLEQMPAVARHRFEKIALLLGERGAQLLGEQQVRES